MPCDTWKHKAIDHHSTDDFHLPDPYCFVIFQVMRGLPEEVPELVGRAPKYRTQGCSRYWRPKSAARKWLKCCKNQCSRSRAVNGWAWTPFCVILWGWLISYNYLGRPPPPLEFIFPGSLSTKGYKGSWRTCLSWPGIISGHVWYAWMSEQIFSSDTPSSGEYPARVSNMHLCPSGRSNSAEEEDKIKRHS